MSTASFAPFAAATGKAVNLAMQRLWLTGHVLPAGARLVARHVFRSEEKEPLEVIYSFPLPRDAALRRFRIKGDDFEAHSELKATGSAVKAYEEGIAQGSLSTLLRQYGDGMVNLTVGNIRPNETVTVDLEILCGVELRDDGFRFRFPFTLAPAYHARMKAAATAPGEGELELPADEFGDLILPRFHQDAASLHEVGFELSICSELPLDEIGSPSHAVRVKQDGGRAVRVALAPEKDVPNRDLVLDSRYKTVESQVLAGPGKDGKGHFAAIVPSKAFGASSESPRRLVILLDRSGSMSGDPLRQACRAIEACLSALSETDSFGLVAFDNRAVAFQPALASATRQARDEARQFLTQVQAAGGTELVTGFLAAAQLLQGRGGDILIFTDGQVSGTEKILADARAAGVRLHCLGIGSASQDRFLALLARETGGVSRFVGARERVDLSAVDLFASVGRPVASELKAGANIQPEPPSCVFAGTPVLLFGEGEQSQENQVELSWQGGRLNLPVHFSGTDVGETVWLLQGSRLITDWESRYPAAEALAPLESRRQNRVASRLLSLSQTYGLASREMSLVAVVTRPGDHGNELPQTRVVPVGMAQDTLFGAYFGDQGILGAPPTAPLQAMKIRVGAQKLPRKAPVDSFDGVAGAVQYFDFTPSTPLAAPPPVQPAEPEPTLPAGDRPWLSRKFGALFERKRRHPDADSEPAQAAEELLFDLAARMYPDGGMPGKSAGLRAGATVIALLAFLSQGYTPTRGAFRSHVARLVAFLKSQTALTSRELQIVAAVIELAGKGKPPAGDWIALARTPGAHWEEVERAVRLP